MKNKKHISKIGETVINRYGSNIKIIEEHSIGVVTVQFDNGYIKNVLYSNFKKGAVRSPYCRSVCGVGFIGEGKYTPSVDGNITRAYDVWASMLKRCYVSKSHLPTYSQCYVHEDWHNFQNFAKWYDYNYYEIYGEDMCLDKDILKKGNKVYSSDTCVFIPRKINNIFTNRKNYRGKYPIGVTKRNKSRYVVRCENLISCTRVEVGRYDTEEDAFNNYKRYKEQYIKDIADLYKDKIPENVYSALYSYTIEIND
jgi:hypothetical protein